MVEKLGLTAARSQAVATTTPSSSTSPSSAGSGFPNWPSIDPREGFWGRDELIHQLLAAFNHARTGDLTICFLEGDPGIGKTTLLARLLQSLSHSGAFLSYAKLLENSPLPLEAIHQITRDINQSLLALSPAELKEYIHLLKEDLGDEIGLLMHLLPGILEEVPSMADLRGQDETISERTALLQTAGRVLGGIASAKHPLVIVYDDIQWLDEDTRDIILEPLKLSQLHHTLLIFSYRSSMNTQGCVGGGLLQACRDLSPGISIEHMRLQPLSQLDSFNHIEALTESCADKRTACQAIYRISKGVPLWSRHIVNLCQTRFQEISSELIQLMDLSGSGTKLVEASMNLLPDPEFDLLKQLVLLRQVMTIRDIAFVVNLSEMDLIELLDNLEAKSWVCRSQDMVRLSHDHLAETVRDLMTTKEQQRVILNLLNGLKNVLASQPDNSLLILEYVSLIKENMDWLPKEFAQELLYWGWPACQILNHRTATRAVLNLVKKLVEVERDTRELGDETLYTSMMELACNSALQLSQHDELNALHKIGLDRIKQPENRLSIQLPRMKSLVYQGKLKPALAELQAMMDESGMPIRITPSGMGTLFKLFRVLWRLERGELELIQEIRETTMIGDSALQALSEITPLTSHVNSITTAHLAAQTIQFVLDKKILRHAAISVAGFAILLGQTPFSQKAKKYGEKARKLALLPQTPVHMQYRTRLLLANKLMHNYVSLPEILSEIRHCIPKLISIGDQQYLGQALYFSIYIGYHAGESLQELRPRALEACRNLRNSDRSGSLVKTLAYTQLLENLSNVQTGDPCEFEGPFYIQNEPTILKIRDDDHSCQFDYSLTRAYLCWFFDRPKKGLECLEIISNQVEGAEGCCTAYVLWWLRAMLAFEAGQRVGALPSGSALYWKIFSDAQARLNKWRTRSADFIESKHLMLKGLACAWKQEWDDAFVHLESAVRAAKQAGRMHESMMGMKLLSNLAWRLERETEAIKYLDQALQIGRQWGAHSVVAYWERYSCISPIHQTNTQPEAREGYENTLYLGLSQRILAESSLVDGLSRVAEFISAQHRSNSIRVVRVQDEIAPPWIEDHWFDGERNIQTDTINIPRNLIGKAQKTWRIFSRDLGVELEKGIQEFIIPLCKLSIAGSEVNWLIHMRGPETVQLERLESIVDLCEPALGALCYIEQLKSDRRNFRQLCDQSSLGILQCSPLGEVVYINECFLSIIPEIVGSDSQAVNLYTAEWSRKWGLDKILDRIKENPQRKEETEILVPTGSRNSPYLIQADFQHQDVIALTAFNISKVASSKAGIFDFSGSEQYQGFDERALEMIWPLESPVQKILNSIQELIDTSSIPMALLPELQNVQKNGYLLGKRLGDLDICQRIPHLNGVSRTSIDLNELVRHLTEQVQGIADEQRLDLVFKENSGSSKVIFAAPHLIRVIFAILHNAFRFTPAGGQIVVEVFTRSGRTGLKVTDTGCGISAVDLPHVIEKYYLGSAKAKGFSGAGLGLFIAKSLSDLNGAILELESISGYGTSVSILMEEPSRRQFGLTPAVDLKADLELGFLKASLEDRIKPLAEHPDLSPKRKVGCINISQSAITLLEDMPEVDLVFLQSQSGYQDHFEYLREDFSALLAQYQSWEFIQARLKVAQIDIPVILLSSQATLAAEVPLGVVGVVNIDEDTESVRKHLALMLETCVQKHELAFALNRLRENQQKLQVLKTRLDQGEKHRMLALVSAGMMHEMRNALNNTIMSLHCLRNMEKVPEDALEIIDSAMEQQEALNKMSIDIRALANPGMAYKAALVDLEDIIDRSLRYLKQELGVTQVYRDFDKRGTQILGYESMILQVLINLISNAIKAMRNAQQLESEQIIRVGTHSDSRGSRIWVEDNGPGIPEDLIDSIFDAYVSSDQAGEGTGLGLALSKSYMNMHDGSIRVDRSFTSGCRIVLEFPNPST
jgi:signal transduction histidine kinase